MSDNRNEGFDLFWCLTVGNWRHFIELVYLFIILLHWILMWIIGCLDKIKEVLSYNNQIFDGMGDNWGGFGHCQTWTGIFLDTFREVLAIFLLEGVLHFISNFISKLYTQNYTLIQPYTTSNILGILLLESFIYTGTYTLWGFVQITWLKSSSVNWITIACHTEQ